MRLRPGNPSGHPRHASARTDADSTADTRIDIVIREWAWKDRALNGDGVMSVVRLTSMVEALPAGRTRTRHQRLLAETGDDILIVVIPYVEAPLWFVTGIVQADMLVREGIPQWRVWTLNEANSILGACGCPAKSISAAAWSFGPVRNQRA